MKKIYVILMLSILIFGGCATSEQTSTSKSINDKLESRTFPVCKVERATKLIPSKPYREAIQEIINTANLEAKQDSIERFYREFNQKKSTATGKPEPVPIQVFEAGAKKDILLVQTYIHPFVATLHQAYSQHYPITISPDMVWLMITQGFANHVNKNGEAMRSYFVDFDGKKNLDVRRDHFIKGDPNNDWESVFEEFSVKIEENTGADLLELVTGDFSTTSVIEKAAFQITLMDAMKSYFTYSMTSLCGIPEVTLEGTVEDWELIEAKAQELAQYDLDWWIDELLPVLKKITQTAKGKPNKDFWESIYKWNELGSGNTFITGWILKFFPYKEINGELVQFIGNDQKPKSKKEIKYGLIATTGEFPNGLSEADMTWNYHQAFYKMKLKAGFIGFHQDTETLSLRPEISWFITETNEKPTEKEIDIYYKGGDEKYLKSIDKQ